MKIRVLIMVLVISAVVIAVSACSPKLPTAPTSIGEYVSNVKSIWNERFGSSLLFESWVYLGMIDSSQKHDSVLSDLTDSDEVFLVNVSKDHSDKLTPVSLSTLSNEEKQEWENVVKNLIKQDQHVVQIRWKDILSGEDLYSTALVDENGMVWDSVMGSVVVEEMVLLTSSRREGSVIIKWIWGAERGKISWSLDCGGPPLECSYESEARMSSGEARIEARLDKTDECCILHYGWAYRAPTGSIKINWNPESMEYDVEVSSWGSTGSGKGVYECCP